MIRFVASFTGNLAQLLLLDDLLLLDLLNGHRGLFFDQPIWFLKLLLNYIILVHVWLLRQLLDLLKANGRLGFIRDLVYPLGLHSHLLLQLWLLIGVELHVVYRLHLLTHVVHLLWLVHHVSHIIIIFRRVINAHFWWRLLRHRWIVGVVVEVSEPGHVGWHCQIHVYIARGLVIVVETPAIVHLLEVLSIKSILIQILVFLLQRDSKNNILVLWVLSGAKDISELKDVLVGLYALIVVVSEKASVVIRSENVMEPSLIITLVHVEIV